MSLDEEIRTQVERILSAPEFSSSSSEPSASIPGRSAPRQSPKKASANTTWVSKSLNGLLISIRRLTLLYRVQTARLRQKLVAYYVDTGRNDEILIVIPRGRYAVNVSFREIQKLDGVSIASTTTTVTPQEKNTITSRFRPFFSFGRPWLAGGLFLLIVAAAAIYARTFW